MPSRKRWPSSGAWDWARTISPPRAGSCDGISAGQVSDVAEDWLGTEQWVWVVTGDRQIIEPQLEAVEWIPDRIVSARVLSDER